MPDDVTQIDSLTASESLPAEHPAAYGRDADTPIATPATTVPDAGIPDVVPASSGYPVPVAYGFAELESQGVAETYRALNREGQPWDVLAKRAEDGGSPQLAAFCRAQGKPEGDAPPVVAANAPVKRPRGTTV